MRTRLFLNPSNNRLVGQYNPFAEHIHCICDSSSAPFSIRLPDVTQPEHKEFIFYNYPRRGIGNTVTLLPVSGQLIINSDTSHVLNPWDTVSACADLKSRWLLSDINSGQLVLGTSVLYIDLNETDERRQVKYRGASGTVYVAPLYNDLET